MDKTKSKLAAFFDNDEEESSFPVRRTKLFACRDTLTNQSYTLAKDGRRRKVNTVYCWESAKI